MARSVTVRGSLLSEVDRSGLLSCLHVNTHLLVNFASIFNEWLFETEVELVFGERLNRTWQQGAIRR